jgi:uncharacterized membrane protein YccC
VEAVAKYRSELRLTIRALIAAALSFVVGEALGLPQSQWAVITALIIVQGSLGGTLGASMDRLAGTLAGAVFGAAAALARQAWDMPALAVLLLAVAPLALLATLRPSFRVAPVTATIVLLASPGEHSAITAALHRVGEITLGTVIGIAVSIIILPSRARHVCAARGAEALELMAQLITHHLQPPERSDRAAINRLNAGVRGAFAKAAAAAQEARREHALRIGEEPTSERLVRTLRRLRSDVAFIGRAAASEGATWQGATPVLGEVAAGFGEVFRGLAEALRTGGDAPDLAPLDGLVAKLRPAMSDGARDASVLPFVIETLRRDLGDLAGVLTPQVSSTASE